MTPLQKIIVAGLLFALWGGFVLMGQSPASDYVSTIKDALIALGVFHMSNQNPPDDPPSPPPVPV